MWMIRDAPGWLYLGQLSEKFYESWAAYSAPNENPHLYCRSSICDIRDRIRRQFRNARPSFNPFKPLPLAVEMLLLSGIATPLDVVVLPAQFPLPLRSPVENGTKNADDKSKVTSLVTTGAIQMYTEELSYGQSRTSQIAFEKLF